MSPSRSPPPWPDGASGPLATARLRRSRLPGRSPISLRAAGTTSSPTTLVGLAYRPRPLGREGVIREDAEAALAALAHPELPIEVIRTGLRHLIVPVGSQQALVGIAPSEAALTGLAASGGADTVCVFARVGDHRVRMRDFCAPIGALEEPASGTTSAALASYLTRHTAAPTPASIVIEQGAEMGRPSRIDADIQTQHGQTVVTVWGSALRTASGTVFPA
jgi:trans-2,3-dihydro-3-hydroxyanthranilate isomerase